ncbi:MAG: hypothetical protein L0H64_06785 [Pseudonocardia sp.]|nr:hypothetical protein [Pseudonocardia sp.]
MIYANAVAVPWSLLLFPVLDIGTPWAFAVGLSVTLGIAYGPVGAYLPELFNTRYRYTAAGMAYNLVAALGGAIPPLLATTLVALYGSFSIDIYLAAMALFSLAATSALTETRENELDAVGVRTRV